MPEILRMPEVSANTVEAILATWNVELNTPYAAGDVIVTVETDKAVVDVEAEAEGVLLRLLVDEGAHVAVGAPIAVWGSAGETAADGELLLSSLGVAADAGVPGADAETGVGSQSAAIDMLPAAAVRAAKVRDQGERIFASPLARKVARDSGLDLTRVIGSGPGGRIRRRDVDTVLADGVSGPAPVSAPEGASPAGAAAQLAYEDIPNSRIRQAIARRLTESKQTAPHFYLRGSARVDKLLDLRREVNSGGNVKVSVNDLVVKAVARAHGLVPGLNVQWNGDSIRQFSGVDIAVAVATENGLVTPVIRGVDLLSLRQLVEATQDLITRAQQRRLQQSELEGGSISVSNLGMFGTEEFAAIINPPQAAILAVGAACEGALVEDGRLVVGTVMRVTLAVDHRPVDGATAAEWMRAFTGLLEQPAQILT